MRISDWSSDVCSYDLQVEHVCINKWGPQPPPYLVQSSCLLTTRPRFLRISQKPTNILLSSRNEFIIFRPKGNRTWQPDMEWTLAPTALAGVCLMGTRCETSACESSRMHAIQHQTRRWRSAGATRTHCHGVGPVQCGTRPHSSR